MRKQKSFPNNAQKSAKLFTAKFPRKLKKNPLAKAAALKAKNYGRKNREQKTENIRPKCATHIKNVAHLFVEHLQIFAIRSVAASTVAANNKSPLSKLCTQLNSAILNVLSAVHCSDEKKIQSIYYIYMNAREEYNATSEQDEHNGTALHSGARR